MRIDDIDVGARHRIDLGDVDGLAASIREVGLLHPIVVTPDGRLIAGARRLEACRRLGMEEVAVTVVSLENTLRGEWAENADRKDFTPSEAVAIGRALEEVERAKARDRQGERTDLRLPENFSGSPAGTTRDIVGHAV